jgi:hypothetical protein
MNEDRPQLSRRDFLKLAGIGLGAMAFRPFRIDQDDQEDIEPISKFEASQYATHSAVKSAIKSFNGAPYSWEGGAYCSSYIARVANHLGLTINSRTGIETETLLPPSGTKLQRDWLMRNFPKYGKEIPMNKLLEPSAWKNVMPGSLFFLPSAIAQNGYNQPSHVAVYTGWELKGPLFSDFAEGMKTGPQKDRTLSDLYSMYRKNGTGAPDLRAYDIGSQKLSPKEMTGYVFDTLAASNEK